MTRRHSIGTMSLWLRAGLLFGLAICLTAAFGNGLDNAVKADEMECGSDFAGNGYWPFTCQCPGTLAPCVYNCYGELYTPWCEPGEVDECDTLVKLFVWDGIRENCQLVTPRCCGESFPPCTDYYPEDIWVYCYEYCLPCN
jgi:hypothetical protein